MSDKVSEWVRTTTESCCCVLWKKHFCIVYTVNTPPLYIYTVYITITAKSLNVPPFPIWYTRRNSLAILKKYSRADVISFLKHGVYKTAYFIVETKELHKENESIFINIYKDSNQNLYREHLSLIHPCFDWEHGVRQYMAWIKRKRQMSSLLIRSLVSRGPRNTFQGRDCGAHNEILVYVIQYNYVHYG